MKKITICATAFAMTCFIACSSNKEAKENKSDDKLDQTQADKVNTSKISKENKSDDKLDQAQAEKVITSKISSVRVCDGKIVIRSIDPISQFSENEASALAHTTFKNAHVAWNWEFKFKFQKNIDKKWILTSVDPGAPDEEDGSDCQDVLCRKWQNLHDVVE